MMGHMMFDDGFWLWGLFGSLFMIAFWAGIIFLIVALVRRGSSRGATTSRGSALRILEERYAKGEIDRDDFVERRKLLTGH